MQTIELTPDLTTGTSEYVISQRARNERFIRQPYELYSAENQRAWRLLYTRMEPLWEHFATTAFMEGRQKLGLRSDAVPLLDDVNLRLAPLTGFRAQPVSGYIPALNFFDSLSRREFPTTVTVRPMTSLDYIAEPDIFHDVAGHVPMHTHPDFAAVLGRFGRCAHTAAELCAGLADRCEAKERVKSIVRGLARAFWFTIEFGLMNSKDGLRAYGSGLLSSHGELPHALKSPRVHRAPFQLEWAIHTHVDFDRYQCLLFVIDSFDQLFGEVEKLERWMKEGRLDNLTRGEPVISDQEAELFLAGVELEMPVRV
jgi:phenylalanine-4-hydroxylase